MLKCLISEFAAVAMGTTFLVIGLICLLFSKIIATVFFILTILCYLLAWHINNKLEAGERERLHDT